MLLMTFRIGESYQMLKKRSRAKKGEPVSRRYPLFIFLSLPRISNCRQIFASFFGSHDVALIRMPGNKVLGDLLQCPSRVGTFM
jgi:hypothetical protein